MTNESAIIGVRARQVLDSRGRPTVEADVRLSSGAFGRAIAPSGASRGAHEAHELRDGDAAVYDGLGVTGAVAGVMREIAPALAGMDAADQREIDVRLRALDGTPTLKRLGGNAVLAVSLAVSRAAAEQRRMPLHAYLNTLSGGAMSMPMPMTNILSGGAHAGRGMDIQDFLVVPVGAQSYSEALSMISRVRASATRVMASRGLSVMLADEGGLSPGLSSTKEGMDLMMDAFAAAGLQAGRDVAIALDIAASELCQDGSYALEREGRRLSAQEMSAYLTQIVRAYPVVSIEDPLDQDDWDGWKTFTAAVPGVQVVGDDLFVTSPLRIAEGIKRKVANTALIKVNQNGTLSGTLDALRTARDAGYATVISARSGETEDSFIADLAVGSGGGQIKIGSVRNSDRMSKYNQLLRIEEEADLPFAGAAALSTLTHA